MKRIPTLAILMLASAALFADGAISMADYLASSEYEWFVTGKTSYEIEAMMVDSVKEIYNKLEDVSYSVEPNGEDVILKGTSDEEWVSPIEKVIKTYTNLDGSTIEKDQFVPNEYLKIKTISEENTNYAMFIPKDIIVTVETAWGDVLTANNPKVEHGDGDYLVCRVGEDGNPDLSDVWVVNGAVFPSTYDLTNRK